MNALTLPATRRRDKVVILTGLAISPACSSTVPEAAARGLRRIARAAFCRPAAAAVTALGIAAMWCHGALDAPVAVPVDFLAAAPWLAAYVYHTGRACSAEKGSEA